MIPLHTLRELLQRLIDALYAPFRVWEDVGHICSRWISEMKFYDYARLRHDVGFHQESPFTVRRTHETQARFHEHRPCRTEAHPVLKMHLSGALGTGIASQLAH